MVAIACLAVLSALCAPAAPPDSHERVLDRVVACVGARTITERELRMRILEHRLFDAALDSATDEELLPMVAAEAVDDVLLEFWAELEMDDPPAAEGAAAGRAAWRRFESLAGSPAKLQARLAQAGIPPGEFRAHVDSRARAELLVQAALTRSLGPLAIPRGRDDPRTAENLRLEQILFLTLAQGDARSEARALEKALVVRRELAQGLPFDRAAVLYSEDRAGADRGGDLGWVRRGDLSPPIREAIRDLPLGVPSPPIRTERGYHIVRIADFESERRRQAQDILRAEEHRQLRRLRAEATILTAPGVVLPPIPGE